MRSDNQKAGHCGLWTGDVRQDISALKTKLPGVEYFKIPAVLVLV